MAFPQLGIRLSFFFRPPIVRPGLCLQINNRVPRFSTNTRQFASRPPVNEFWTKVRARYVFRLVNSSARIRGVRTLRRGFVPGSLAYHAAKNGEANIERSNGPSQANSSVFNKPVTSSRRGRQARRLFTTRNVRNSKETNESSKQLKRSNSQNSKEPAPPSEQDSQSNFHMPTKEQLLATATSFFSRLHIRFKWPLIRSLRPFNMDDISAFVSVYLLSHAFLLIAGTTTFFLLIIATVNSVGAQEYLAGLIGRYLTRESGITVVFESAIVPKWRNKTIRFEKVFVSKRPQAVQRNSVRKGSTATAVAAAAAAAVAERSNEEFVLNDDGNYTQYDVTIDSVDVTLSFMKWMNGKGLLENVEVRGVRGVVGTSP